VYYIHQEQRYASNTNYKAAADNDNDEETFFDWYQDYSTLKHYIDPYLTLAGRRLKSTTGSEKDIEILIPGCGNSS
jgi:hypothetical protein